MPWLGIWSSTFFGFTETQGHPGALRWGKWKAPWFKAEPNKHQTGALECFCCFWTDCLPLQRLLVELVQGFLHLLLLLQRLHLSTFALLQGALLCLHQCCSLLHLLAFFFLQGLLIFVLLLHWLLHLLAVHLILPGLLVFTWLHRLLHLPFHLLLPGLLVFTWLHRLLMTVSFPQPPASAPSASSPPLPSPPSPCPPAPSVARWALWTHCRVMKGWVDSAATLPELWAGGGRCGSGEGRTLWLARQWAP